MRFFCVRFKTGITQTFEYEGNLAQDWYNDDGLMFSNDEDWAFDGEQVYLITEILKEGNS